MAEKRSIYSERQGSGRTEWPNVKPSRNYERFGETIRYLTLEELQKLFDCIEDYRHKLMLELIYQLGCRVGEFVRIQLKHIDFGRSSVYFPAENTKTQSRRTSWVPRGLMNEVASMLKSQGRMSKRDGTLRKPESFLFHPPGKPGGRYSENRIRQVFLHYVRKAGLDREYGQDTRGRKLHQFTIHSMRHSHISHYVQIYKVPLPIVQKQVGHKTLKATSVYLKPSDEAVAEAYAAAAGTKSRGAQ